MFELNKWKSVKKKKKKKKAKPVSDNLKINNESPTTHPVSLLIDDTVSLSDTHDPVTTHLLKRFKWLPIWTGLWQRVKDKGRWGEKKLEEEGGASGLAGTGPGGGSCVVVLYVGGGGVAGVRISVYATTLRAGGAGAGRGGAEGKLWCRLRDPVPQ